MSSFETRLTGLEQHEGEKLTTELSFFGVNYPINANFLEKVTFQDVWNIF